MRCRSRVGPPNRRRENGLVAGRTTVRPDVGAGSNTSGPPFLVFCIANGEWRRRARDGRFAAPSHPLHFFFYPKPPGSLQVAPAACKAGPGTESWIPEVSLTRLSRGGFLLYRTSVTGYPPAWLYSFVFHFIFSTRFGGFFLRLCTLKLIAVRMFGSLACYSWWGTSLETDASGGGEGKTLVRTVSKTS